MYTVSIIKSVEMKKEFKNIGEIEIVNLSEEKASEAGDLIYSTYQREGIWLEYSREQVAEEIESSFRNICYRPIFICVFFQGKMIGLASYMESHISSDAFELSFATVIPEFQAKGLGSYLVYLRIKKILESVSGAFFLTRARAPQIFERFGFTYLYKTKDTHGTPGPFDYMFCHSSDINQKYLQEVGEYAV